MTAAKTDIRIVHAGDLSTKEAMALDWKVGVTGHRFQELVVHASKVVGSWRYNPEVKGKSWTLDSEYTEISRGYQRRGLAIKLWMHGIGRWRPVSRINATIGTPEGLKFLARMTAELAYAHPNVHLSVKVEQNDHDTWQWLQQHEAQALLKRLGHDGAAQKQLTAAKPLQLKAAS